MMGMLTQRADKVSLDWKCRHEQRSEVDRDAGLARAAGATKFTLGITMLAVAAIIGAAILFVFRWEVAIGSGQVVRLDRWTGTVIACNVAPEAARAASEDNAVVELDCSAPTAPHPASHSARLPALEGDGIADPGAAARY